ncbi:MAG TPA: cysteine--tRNA ligase [Erysipelotrichaceae bacterium]|nr:cysteine--tRNA ligase [Erysipelotrichaceae bacterium]
MKFYNSLSNSLEDFHTLEKGKVSIYVCGPTVYNYPHIGNMRPVVIFDILRRFLTYVGYDVTYVSNYTDVDDKIIKAAKQEGKSEKELADYYIAEFEKSVAEIGSISPTIKPRVTEYMDEIIAYIDNLVKIGAAYEINGDVYFRVNKIKDYGILSGVNIEDLKVGARVEENSLKESPVDFALWKRTDEGIKWPSPWGEGRPGWHTECCVMIDAIFPNHLIDIHGGGYDLKFPHHENEIAQSEATHQNKIARYWMHNAFINIENEKMSKSLGNVIYAKEVIARYGGPVTRLVILNAHYRQTVNFTDETIKEAQQIIQRLQSAYKQAALKLQTNKIDINEGQPLFIDKFLEALADDLKTANALSEVYDVLRRLNLQIRSRETDFNLLNNLFKTLTDMFYILGLDISYVVFDSEISLLYEQYLISKKNKDFAKSDEIRDFLIEKGIM